MNRKIDPAECALLSRYVQAASGILVDPGKAYLFETRLGGLLHGLGLPNYKALVDRAQADHTGKLERRIIDAVSTNETLFFRDERPFELLRHKILPELIDRRSPRYPPPLSLPLRIWSAACATGQEVYSVAIVLKELLPDPDRYRIRLLGTDISGNAVTKASLGRFNAFEMQRGMPDGKQGRYFKRDGDAWQIKDEIRAMVSFRRLNLLNSLAGLGRFDIILMRNVAIYFDRETRKKVFAKVARLLESDGCLIIGATESLTGICPELVPRRYLKSVYYQPERS